MSCHHSEDRALGILYPGTNKSGVLWRFTDHCACAAKAAVPSLDSMPETRQKTNLRCDRVA